MDGFSQGLFDRPDLWPWNGDGQVAGAPSGSGASAGGFNAGEEKKLQTASMTMTTGILTRVLVRSGKMIECSATQLQRPLHVSGPDQRSASLLPLRKAGVVPVGQTGLRPS